DWVDLRGNPLSDKAIDEDIPMLEGRGVTVRIYPYSSLKCLIEAVESMDIGGSLIARLRAAERALDNGDEETAIDRLNAFIDQCEKMRSTKLTDQQAEDLIGDAHCIIAGIF
ncbi:hypothetical protein ACFL3Q_16045, partial [Planctomycetota bacterium]